MKVNRIFQEEKTKQRELAKSAGYYDGRFKTQIIVDKRKKESKEFCRNFKF